jgi:hypothetical protein
MNEQLTKEKSRKRWSELRALLNQWDFIGVMDVGIEDEYECMIGPLLLRLESGQTVAQISQFLEDNLRDHFGMHRVDDLDAFAKRVKSWFDEKWSGSVT